MVKFLTALGLVGLIVLVPACTKHPGLTPVQNAECNVETALAGGISVAIAGSLNCSKPDAIKSSILLGLGNINICAKSTSFTKTLKVTPNMKGAIGNYACPLAMAAIIGFVSNSLPSAWSCAPAQAVPVEVLSTVVVTACEAAIPI
jgi:hypothetical protein